jgi:tripartite-type tricarboxylate transporter receptor subunit TctC
MDSRQPSVSRLPRRVLPVLAAALAMPAVVRAQGPFPSRQVRIIVPFPAGGSNDISARVAAEQLRQIWNQPVVVENVSGAGGNIGAATVARAEPDGHTLLVTPPGPLAINQFLFRSPGYDAGALIPVVVLNATPNVAIVSVATGISTLPDLIARARARPDGMTFASQGIGTTSHLTGMLFQVLTGTQLTHVPYRGEAPAMTDVVGGRVDMIFSNVTGALAHHQAGRVRMLAIADTERAAEAPEVPTGAELGLAGFLSTAWFAAVAPPGTPQAVVARLSEGFNEALQRPEVQRRYRELGARVIGGSVAETAAFVSAERGRWGDLVRRAQLEPQ